MITTIVTSVLIAFIGAILWRMNSLSKAEALLQEQTKQTKKDIEYQDEVIQELTKHITIDDTIDSLQSGKF